MRVLVIRLAALGDFFLSFPPFAAIRAHHPGATITLLTTAPYAPLGRAAPWFDEVVIDERPAVWDVPGLLRLRAALRGFDIVYDLQTSSRSSRYFHLAGRPVWSGIARGCTLPDDDPARDRLHTRDRQAGQLRRAGIPHVPEPDLSWLRTGPPPVECRYAMLVPGAAPHRPAKRWPAERFGEIAADLEAAGTRPIVVGARDDAPLAAAIVARAPATLDLTGRTDLLGLARVAAGATLAIGNDTGPMHVAATLGCRAIVLFSGESDPALTAPRGPARIDILRADPLDALGADLVKRLLVT